MTGINQIFQNTVCVCVCVYECVKRRKKRSHTHICRRWKPAISMSGSKAQVHYSIHTGNCTVEHIHTHTHTHTYIFFLGVLNPARREIIKCQWWKGRQGTTDELPHVSSSLRCSILHLRSKETANWGVHAADRRAITHTAMCYTIQYCKVSSAVQSCKLDGCSGNEKDEVVIAATSSKLITKHWWILLRVKLHTVQLWGKMYSEYSLF